MKIEFMVLFLDGFVWGWFPGKKGWDSLNNYNHKYVLAGNFFQLKYLYIYNFLKNKDEFIAQSKMQTYSHVSFCINMFL